MAKVQAMGVRIRRRSTFLLISLAAAIALCPGIATAGPENGIGTYLGIIGAQEGSTATRGISVGLDAQFAVDDDWSLVPYLMLSNEWNTSPDTVSDGLTGVQLRRWMGNWFFGAHLFVHDRLTISNGIVIDSIYGLASGLLAGYEGKNGWGTEVQLDAFEGTPVRGVRRSAVHLHLTYRWH